MLLFSKLLLWAWIVTYVLAFIPIYPPWKCVEDGKCPDNNVKRGLGGRRADESLTLKIRKRVPTNGLPASHQMKRHLEQLTKKFKNAAVVHGKRTNTFAVVSATPPTQTNSIALHQDGADFSYFIQVNLGASGKPLWMLMDTGASSTWVMGSTCSSPACKSHSSFGPSDSGTYRASQKPFSIGYGTGVVSGTYATDTMSLAGFSLSLTFGIANQTSDDFTHFPFDGIMGLSTNPGDFPTFLDVLMSSKILKSNIFGVNIDRAADGVHDGEINFGAPDTSKYTGSLGYNTVTKPGSWLIAVDGVGFNGKSAGISGRHAFIDTGTSYCFLPPDDAKALHGLIPGSQFSAVDNTWYVPCTTTSSIQFTFSGVPYNISTKDWIGGKMGSLCASNIYSGTPVGTGNWLLGDAFMKNVYTVFDADQKRIGFGIKPTNPTMSLVSTSSPVSTGRSSLSLSQEVTKSTSGSSQATTLVSTTSSMGKPGSSGGFNAAITSSSVSPTSAPQPAPAASMTSTSHSTTYRVSSVLTILAFLGTLSGML